MEGPSDAPAGRLPPGVVRSISETFRSGTANYSGLLRELSLLPQQPAQHAGKQSTNPGLLIDRFALGGIRDCVHF